MSNNYNKKIEGISFAQKQRLAFIDFLLMFKGSFVRSDLTSKFHSQKRIRERLVA